MSALFEVLGQSVQTVLICMVIWALDGPTDY